MIDRKRFSWIPCAWLLATPALAEEPDATLRAIETSVAAEAMQSAIDAADAAFQARIDAVDAAFQARIDAIDARLEAALAQRLAPPLPPRAAPAFARPSPTERAPTPPIRPATLVADEPPAQEPLGG